MKTSTVIGIAVIGAIGLGAYWLWTKRQQNVNTTGVSIPIGNSGGGVTATIPTTVLAGGLATLFNGVVQDIGGVFSGGTTQTQPTNYADSSTYSTPIATTDYGATDTSYLTA